MSPRGGTNALKPEPALHPGGPSEEETVYRPAGELSATQVVGSELWCSGTAAGHAQAGSAEKKLLEEESKDEGTQGAC